MKLAIIGSPKTFESINIENSSKRLFKIVDRFSLKDLKFDVDENAKVYWNDIEIIEYYDAFLLRGINPYEPLAYFIVNFAYKKEKCIVDEKFVTKNTIGTKLATTASLAEAGLPVPKTFTSFSIKKIKEEIVPKLGYPLVFKTVDGRKGKDVYKIEDSNQLEKIIKSKKDQLGSFIFQECIENNFDLRVFIVGYRAIGAMKRTAGGGDFRTNIAVGGTGSNFKLTDEISKIAEKAAMVVQNEIAGVDIMLDKNDNPYILEVNRAPQFKGFTEATGIDVGKLIAEYVYQKAKKLKEK